MEKYYRVMVKVVASVSGDPLGKPEMNNGATGLRDRSLDHVEDLNLTDVSLLCHYLLVGAFVIKLVATMLFMTICTMHGINNKFMDSSLYLLHKYILLQPNSLSSNMYHTKVIVKKSSTITRAYILARMDVCCSKRAHTKI